MITDDNENQFDLKIVPVNSTSVNVTCEFLNDNPYEYCVVIVHPLNKSGGLTIIQSYIFQRVGNIAHGLIGGIDSNDYQFKAIGAIRKDSRPTTGMCMKLACV